VILTSDGDMTTLINDRVSLWQGNRLTKENKYGPFPCKYTPVYKALVGDGKEYKGAVGFGDGPSSTCWSLLVTEGWQRSKG
jgi:hypothetical protein